MRRRSFLKNSIITSSGLIILPSFLKAGFGNSNAFLSELEKNFINPPSSSRPWCFWMWMNGNITKEGITADLEAMNRMGIGGVIIFNAAVGIPRGPVDYASDAWMEATAHAVREAQRLGIDMTIHNAPGYSGAGGPWVTPEMSMQQLVWTETLVTSNGNIDVNLPKPYAKRNYYRDAFVIAYPSLPVEKALMKDKLVKVLVNGKEIDKNILTDGNPETKIRLEVKGQAASTNGEDYDIANGTLNNQTATAIPGRSNAAVDISIIFEFNEPFEARAISILRKPEIPRDLFDGPRDHPPVFQLQSSDDGINYKSIGTVRAPELREMDTPAALSFSTVSAKFYRLILSGPSWVSDVQLHNGPRLGGWPGKTSHTHGESNGTTPGLTNELIIDPLKVVDVSGKLNSAGNLKWNAPNGNWTILRIGHTSTGEENAAHPDAGKGLEIDKFRKEALDFHFANFLDEFFALIKPNIGKSFKGITVDSWEAGKQNWTINFPAEFRKRKSYDITSWMPALTGRIVGSVDDTEGVLWDVRKVQADLLSENFYGHFAEQCHKRGLIFNAEPYGDGNFDSLQANQHLDVPMAEFWTRYIYGSDIYSKQAVSAAHIYGKKVAAAEAFTAMPATSKWTDYPYSLKAEGDYFFSLGINRLVFHTFVHQPYMTAKPGMTMGPFGMHIDRNNTWTEQAYGWINHLKRSQYLLQQGLAVVDVCFFKGDNPESGVPDVYRFLPEGYAGDVIGADALHKRVKVTNGKIVFPDGMQYKVCMMASLQNILPSSINKIRELVAEGMILIVYNKPLRSFGYASKDEEVIKITDELYGDINGTTIKERTYGKGKIFWGKSTDEVFRQLNIQPDFQYTGKNQDATIHYVHKTIGDTEFYFVTNHKRRRENIVCSFRTLGRQPELWNPETGSIVNTALYKFTQGRTSLPIELEPAGSVFVLFRKKALKNGYEAIMKDGKELVTTKAFSLPNKALYADVQNSFTITLWAKPDTFAQSGRSMLFHPPGGQVYGEGHSAIGLSAGQNAVRVHESGGGGRGRGGGGGIALQANQPLDGWTHIGLVYDQRKPSLYLNGKLVATGTASSNNVHPGLGTPSSPEQFSSYFEGNYTPPRLYKRVLSQGDILQEFNKGLPEPQDPSAIQVSTNKEGKLRATITQNGKYTIKGAATKELGQIKDCRITKVEGPWKIQFQKGLGAPTQITLPSLISLHKHSDFNVRHFSGTATYLKTMTISKTDLASGQKLLLDLGRVEVVAEVIVNGKKLGNLWKEPFVIDITKAVFPGINSMQIQVTNLWANRLIGDDHLPSENEYSEHHFIKKLPDWYINNKPKPGERVTFTVWKNLEKTDPLLESGLLGPVRLFTAVEKII